MISLASAALALLLLQVVLVALAAAVRPSANIYLTIVIISVVTTPVAVVSDTILLGQTLRQDGRVFMALINLALGGFLFHFMTLPDRSVTLRILVELLMAPLYTEAVREDVIIDVAGASLRAALYRPARPRSACVHGQHTGFHGPVDVQRQKRDEVLRRVPRAGRAHDPVLRLQLRWLSRRGERTTDAYPALAVVSTRAVRRLRLRGGAHRRTRF